MRICCINLEDFNQCISVKTIQDGGIEMEAQEMLGLKKWAVIGASNKEDGFGYKIYRKLKQEGYTVYPISPNYDEVDGDKAYKSIRELPEIVDVAEFIVNRHIALKIVEEVIEVGVKNIWLQPGSRSETMLEVARTNNIEAVESCVLYELKHR